MVSFEAPPEDALAPGERSGSVSQGVNAEQVRRDLKNNKDEWAKVYGTKDAPPTTRNTLIRWEEQPGFEIRRRVVESTKVDPTTGAKTPPTKWRYEMWARWTGEVTPKQRKALRKKLIGPGAALDNEGEPEAEVMPALVPDLTPPGVALPVGASPEAESIPVPPVPLPPAGADIGTGTPTNFA